MIGIPVVSYIVYDHMKPAPGSISQTATSANGNATNSVTSNAPSGSAVNQPAVQQSATAQKQGDATNTVASGQGNATAPGSSVVSGVQPITVYAEKGSIVNLNPYPSIPVPAKSAPDTMITVGGKKFSVATIEQFNEVQKALQSQHYQGSSAGINFFIADDPSFAPAYNEAAIQLFVQGKYNLAEEEWKRAIARDPTNVLYYNNLSQARSRGSLSITPLFPQSQSRVTLPAEISGTHLNQGTFLILNESDVPVYDVVVEDYAVDPTQHIPEVAARQFKTYKLSHDGFPPVAIQNGILMAMAMKRDYDEIMPLHGDYSDTGYGASVAINPSLLNVLEEEVTFSRQPHGKTETLDFKFVVGRNAAGQLAWFPKL